VIYAYDITTEIGVTQNNPLRTPLKVTKGLIYQVEIEFPPGPLGLCHVVINDGGHQVWPSNPGNSFHGDNGMIVFPDSYLKLVEPYEFTALTWNEDDSYEHTIQLRLGMVSSEIFMGRFLPSISYEAMLEVLRQTQLTQEAERQRVLEDPFPWAGE